MVSTTPKINGWCHVDCIHFLFAVHGSNPLRMLHTMRVVQFWNVKKIFIIYTTFTVLLNLHIMGHFLFIIYFLTVQHWVWSFYPIFIQECDLYIWEHDLLISLSKLAMLHLKTLSSHSKKPRLALGFSLLLLKFYACTQICCLSKYILQSSFNPSP